MRVGQAWVRRPHMKVVEATTDNLEPKWIAHEAKVGVAAKEKCRIDRLLDSMVVWRYTRGVRSLGVAGSGSGRAGILCVFSLP